MKVTTYGAAQFKARCLELMDAVGRTRVPIVVTKRGKPIVRIEPASAESDAIFGALKGMVTYMGDVVSPVDVDWEAER